jgi:hypothetical protein
MKKFFLYTAFVAIMLGCSKGDYRDPWDDSVIPVSLVGIETVNFDNSGEFPKVTATSVKKEAYLVGIKWITDYVITSNDKFITEPIKKGEQTYSSLGNPYSRAIKCNTPFNSTIPAGEYVSKFFKEIDKNYLPADIDEGFVLLVAPDPGEHSFTVEYYQGNTLKFSHNTQPINFY